MDRKAFSTLTDQVAEVLREGMFGGRWINTLPGRDRLAEELGCSHWTIEEALRRLVREGLLVSEGPGRNRRIVLPEGAGRAASLRVRILLYENSDRSTDHLLKLLGLLHDAGHDAEFASRTMHELGMDVERIARYVKATEADAWVVVAGSSGLLEWFAGQTIPAFALFGRLTQVALAGVSVRKGGALQELVDRLIDLGHRRVVMIAREERRKPTPGLLEQSFLDRLRERGIATGSYHLPDWGDGPSELHQAIDSLFRHTPPTAVIMGEAKVFFAVMQHLSRMKISAPGDVSLACTDTSSVFGWGMPEITHITWDSKPLVQRVVGWVSNISRGKEDLRKREIDARFVVGGTIGPVPSSRKI